MNIYSSRFLRRACAILISLGIWGAGAAAAAGESIRILVGFPAGGTIDVVTRQLAEQMQADLGVPVLVENAPGAGGQLAALALKRAAPNGQTLMVAPDHTMVIVPLTLARPGFNVAADFAPIGMVADYAGALAVSQSSGVTNFSEFVAYVKAHPGASSVGISAPGSKPQFQLDTVGRQLNVAMTPVPYRGSVPMVQDIAGGHLFAGITALGDFLEFHRAGKLKVIGITGESRSPALPEIPTVKEQGQSMKLDFWVGMFAPAGTPVPVVGRLNQSLNKALESAKVRSRMAPLAFEPLPSRPEDLSRRIAADTRLWAPQVTSAGWVRQ